MECGFREGSTSTFGKQLSSSVTSAVPVRTAPAIPFWEAQIYLSSLKDKTHNPISQSFVEAVVFMWVKIMMSNKFLRKILGPKGFSKMVLSLLNATCQPFGNVIQAPVCKCWMIHLSCFNSLFLWLYLAVTCAVMQRSGAGLHTASSCFWDTTTDGKYPHPNRTFVTREMLLLAQL